MSFIGIDLHSDCFTAAYIIVKDDKLDTKTISYRLDEKSLESFKSKLTKTDYVVVETSTNAFWFHDQVIGLVKACYVYNTNKARQEGNKTDKIDAGKLARKLAYFICMGGNEEDLPTVYVPDKEVRKLRSLFSSYTLYTKQMTQAKNRAHSILRENGIRIKKSEMEKKDFETILEEYKLPKIDELQIKSFLKSRRVLKELQEEIKDTILFLGSKLFGKEIEILLSIKGFSSFTAICLMSEVVDLKRFANSKKFCSYLRATPKVKASNKNIKNGKVNKTARSRVCTLLTQSVLHFVKDEGYIKNFYERVKVGKSAGKVRIAVIRKILASAFNMLKKNEIYYWVDKEAYERKLREYRGGLEKISNKKLKIVA